jgi:cyanophycin synthetase
LFLNQRQLEKGDRANWAAGHKILLNRSVEAAVCESGALSILSEGLAYDRCQVAVVTNLDPAAQQRDYYVETPEQMFNVLRTVVDVVLSDGAAVLNADDPMVVKMAELCDGSVIYFGLDPDLPVIAEHRAHGKSAVIVRDGWLVLAAGEAETPLTEIAAIPLSSAGQESAQIGSILAAVGAAWALGLTPDLISAGIRTFGLHQAGQAQK